MSAVTVTVDSNVANALIAAAGFTAEADRSYTRPGKRSRYHGGRGGPDFLWEKDEVLGIALETLAAAPADTRAEAIGLLTLLAAESVDPGETGYLEGQIDQIIDGRPVEAAYLTRLRAAVAQEVEA